MPKTIKNEGKTDAVFGELLASFRRVFRLHLGGSWPQFGSFWTPNSVKISVIFRLRFLKVFFEAPGPILGGLSLDFGMYFLIVP